MYYRKDDVGVKRKRITQMFPFLLPLRKAQRKLFFYAKMFFDKHRYARTKSSKLLPFYVHEARTQLINENTGFDMKYQENKVFNLHLAAEPINGILIKPQETFSFWQFVRYAEKNARYKEGLSIENGDLVIVTGGGLCHLSNFLFWMFLHTPLIIVERHPHRVKKFPSPDKDKPDSVDATVSEGWLDLKVKNETDRTFQVKLTFDESHIYGRILADKIMPCRYVVLNRNKQFFKTASKVYEQVTVCRQEINLKTEEILSETLLYTDESEIGYPLPLNANISTKQGVI